MSYVASLYLSCAACQFRANVCERILVSLSLYPSVPLSFCLSNDNSPSVTELMTSMFRCLER